ncbi:hypothetical protein [Microbacterium enclense]|uniref:hypothetical protein n=1 Tax=Microbacterium enclense TaxID=993073 RepID=UPI003433632C
MADAYGTVLNRYMDRELRDRAPERPWAMYLAGTDQRFRFLAFDLDAHGDAAAPLRDLDAHGDAAAPLRDLDVLTGHLVDAGIPFLVCESGPAGGRHVWVGLVESVDAATVATLNRLVKHLCPSLDLSPLSNPVTGCVRPPGSPHRDGGVSTPLTGALDVLTAPQTPAAAIRALVTRLAVLVDDTEPAESEQERPSGPLPVDAHRRLYLPGRRRELPAVSATALRELPAGADASAQLWRVLIGAASARWHHADVAALVDDAEGLEHVRTRTSPRGRTPRPLGARVRRKSSELAGGRAAGELASTRCGVTCALCSRGGAWGAYGASHRGGRARAQERTRRISALRSPAGAGSCTSRDQYPMRSSAPYPQ